jgi:Tol biopolymer transport system component
MITNPSATNSKDLLMSLSVSGSDRHFNTRRALCIGAVLTAVVAVFLGIAFTAHANPNPLLSPDQTKIAHVYGEKNKMFVRDVAEGEIVDREGKNQKPIFDGPMGGWIQNPTWSPNGKNIALVHGVKFGRVEQVGRREVLVVSLPSIGHPYGKLITLSEPADDRVASKEGPLSGRTGAQVDTLSWSPDGRRVAYVVRVLGGEHDVFIGDIESGTSTKVTADPFNMPTKGVYSRPGRQTGPLSWSPDGKRLAYTWLLGDHSMIQVINVEDERKAKLLLTVEGKIAGNSPWSPDGTRLVYQKGSLIQNIWTVEVEDRDVNGDRWARQLTDLAMQSKVKSIAFSPKGEQIAYLVKEGGQDSIVVMGVDGTNQNTLSDDLLSKEISDESSSQIPIMWSPDGASIVYSGVVNGNLELFLIGRDGEKHIHLSNDGFTGWAQHPLWFRDWSPIADAILRKRY